MGNNDDFTFTLSIPRRFHRFRVLTLLWITAVVALAVGWWLDHRRITQETQLAIDQLRRKNDTLTRQYDTLLEDRKGLMADITSEKKKTLQVRMELEVLRRENRVSN